MWNGFSYISCCDIGDCFNCPYRLLLPVQILIPSLSSKEQKGQGNAVMKVVVFKMPKVLSGVVKSLLKMK